MPETPPSNSQLLLSRKKSTDSKPPSCSERPLTLFHTAQPNEKRKCAEPPLPAFPPDKVFALIVIKALQFPRHSHAVLLVSVEETIPLAGSGFGPPRCQAGGEWEDCPASEPLTGAVSGGCLSTG